MQHCSLNVALYGKTKRWAMTERRFRAVHQQADTLSIGPSALSWDGSSLAVQIDEIAVPVPRRIRGTVRLYPAALESRSLPLDDAGHHRWQPIAPCARVEVAFDRRGLSWSGPAYFDTNHGDRPLDADFVRWNWSRAQVPGGTAVLYDITHKNGRSSLAMRYDEAGGVEDFVPPPVETLPPSPLWRVPRQISATAPSILDTLEDTPFYTRSIITADLLGSRVTAMHESLDMTRFTTPWVQAMLPFRMPRR